MNIVEVTAYVYGGVRFDTKGEVMEYLVSNAIRDFHHSTLNDSEVTEQQLDELIKQLQKVKESCKNLK